MISFKVFMDGSDSNTKNINLYRKTNCASAPTLIDNHSDGSSADTNIHLFLGGGGLVIATGQFFFLEFDAGGTSDRVMGLTIFYDVPA